VSNVARRLPFTYQDLVWMPDDGKRRELIDGDVFVTPSPNTVHQTVSRLLQFELMMALERTGLALVFDAPIDVMFDEANVVQPDLIVVHKAHEHIVTMRAIEGAPDIIVEILSPGTAERDRHYKRKLYEHFQVPEYWIVDPEHGQMEILALVDTIYGIRARYDRSSTLTCPLFPTLSVGLLPIFNRV
jgi:Uma2 family endonuclease